MLLQASYMTAVPQLVSCGGEGIRVHPRHTLRFLKRMCQKGPEAVDIERGSSDPAPDTAAHHIKAGGQMKQRMPA